MTRISPDRKSGTYDVLDIESTRDTFAITLGKFVPDELDAKMRIAELLRKHGAFSDDLLKELVKLAEAEWEKRYDASSDAHQYDWEYE